jgi:hypothetical protein
MSSRSKELLIVLITLIGVFIAQRVFHSGVISYAPAPVLLAVILTWSIPRAWRYLIVIAIVSELFTTLPLGILSLTIAMPLGVYLLRGRIEADISFSFLSLILVSVFLQFVVLTSFDVVHNYIAEGGQSIISVIPWRLLFSSWLITSAMAFAACVIITNQMPPEHHNIITLAGRRSHG